MLEAAVTEASVVGISRRQIEMMRGSRAGRWRTVGRMWCACLEESALLQRPKVMVVKRDLLESAAMAIAAAAAVVAVPTPASPAMLVLVVVSQKTGAG
jgi:hypothetical protein